MAASVFDSAVFAKLFATGEAGRLFSDSAEVRAMLLVEGALAKVQGAAGVIPEISGAAIHRASLEVQIDPAGLAEATGHNGVSVPGLVAAFRQLMQAPEHAQYIHWGATSQDIVDTALMLRLRQVLALYDADLRGILAALAALAETHAETPMMARTYGQHATVTSFGAQAAQWGWPLLGLHAELVQRRDAGLPVSLSGAAGTGSALGAETASLRAALAQALGLSDPGRSWHSDRSVVTSLAAWITRASGALGKLGEDLLLATQSGLAELRLGAVGASSTMPQKHNPVAPSVLVALARQAVALNAGLQGAALHRQQRDGAAWFTEWLALPQLCLGLSAGLVQARALTEAMQPDPAAMAATLEGSQDLWAAEALSFALSARMPRPEAQAAVRALCEEVIAGRGSLRAAAQDRWPDLDAGLFAPAQQMGAAPTEARAFATQVRRL